MARRSAEGRGGDDPGEPGAAAPRGPLPAGAVRFEGARLEDVLAEVYARLGDQAVIVSANRLRTGGMAGFFAKERFEVIAAPAPGAAPAAGPPGGSRAAGDVPDRPPSSRAGGGGAAASALVDDGLDFDDDEGLDEAPRSLLDLADEVSAVEREDALGPSDPFARLLDRELRSAVDPVTPSVLDATAPAPPPPPMPSPRARVPETPLPAPAPAPARRSAGGSSPAGAASAGVPPATSPVVPVSPPLGPAARTPPGGPTVGAPRAPSRGSAATEPAPQAALPPPAADETLAGGSPALPRLSLVEDGPEPAGTATRGVARSLRAFGLPGALTPPAAFTVWDLLRVFEVVVPAEGVAAPARGVVAVVGPTPACRETAEHLAQRIEIDPDEVLVASPRRGPEWEPSWVRLRKPADAEARQANWRRRKVPVLVAVEDAGRGDAGAAWLAQMLTALAPVQVRAVLDARTSPVELRAELARLGPVDAVDAVGVARALTPGVLLGLGVPVASLDGHPATAGTWAALVLDWLCER